MLKIIKTNVIKEETLEIDQFIPLKIRWYEPNKNNKKIIYWRTGDLKNSMLEIGISENTGEIRSLTIVSINRTSFLHTKEIFPCVGVINKGSPVFDISKWIGEKVVNDAGDFKIEISNKELNIIIKKDCINQEIISGRVAFGLNKEMNVCRILIQSLSSQEQLQIKDTFDFILSAKC